MTSRYQTPPVIRTEEPLVRLSRFTSPWNAAARYVAQRIVLQGVVRGVTRVRIVGRDQREGLRGACVVVANHSSHLDAPLVFTTLPRQLARYLAAGAAADYFFDVRWRRGLTSLFFNAFPIQRGTGRRRSAASELLGHGVPVLVFPEGTRSSTGADYAHPRGSKWPKAGRPPVGVVFGAPVFATAGERPDDYMRRVRTEVMRLHEQHEALGRTRRGLLPAHQRAGL